MRTLCSALLVLALAPFAMAASFTLLHDGEPLSGGQVCLFEAGAPDDPVKRLTTFSSVTCTEANESVALQEGTWNLFARHASGFVSDLLLVKDQRVEGDRREIALVPARPLSVAASKDEAERVAMYVEGWGTVLPLVPGETSLLVPEKERVFALFMRERAIVAIGKGLLVGDEELPAVVRPSTPAGTRDLAVGVVPDLPAFEALASEERLPGTISLSGSGLESSLAAVDDVAPAFAARPILALFRNVPRLDGLGASVVGDGWADTRVELNSDGTPAPLIVAPATALAVRWSVASDVPDLVNEFAAQPPCERQEAQTKRPYPEGTPTEGRSVSLWRCPGVTPDYRLEHAYIQRCELVSAKALPSDELFGEAVLEGVTTGLYLLRLAHEPLPATFRLVEIDRPSQLADIDLEFDRWFGTITYGGEPIRAAVDLGWGGVSDAETGEYTSIRAVVPAPVKPQPPSRKGFAATIWVEACIEEIAYGYIPEETPLPNSRLDIDIPLNEVRVVARSSETGQAIEGATISMGAAVPETEGEEARPSAHFAGEWGQTDADGRFSIANVPPNRRLFVCARHDDYEMKCADPITLGEDRERELTLVLAPADIRIGRVNRQGLQDAVVAWFGPNGGLTEYASIKGDGSFTYKKDHTEGEPLFVIASNAALWATRHPRIRDDEVLELRYPEAPVRWFEVSLSPDAPADRGLMTLVIGDITVPRTALIWHGSRRGLPMSVVTKQPSPVSDILATGPVVFLFASDLFIQANMLPGGDVFYSPAAISLPRTPAGDSTRVVLGGTGSNLRIATSDAAEPGR